MDFFPLFANLRDQPCLVVGGGAVAARKARELVAAGARVTVNAPECTAAMDELLATSPGMQLHRAAFDPALIRAHVLVVAATSDPSVNRAVAEAARNALRLCNVVDDAAASSFIVPAIVDRSPLIVAVSSGGASPVLARLLRQRLEQWLPAELGQLATWAGRWRERVRQTLPDLKARRAFWERLLSGPAGAAVLRGEEHDADTRAAALLDQPATRPETGHAWLVGAGPGDPRLISVRGLQAIEQADVVLHDRLVSPQLVRAARREAEIICVGKTGGGPSTSQDEINALLLDRVRAGLKVCRLKGGDPLVFGRGGEEALALARAGLPFEIVPGISAANGCAAYAGIPLTHRGVSGAVTFVSAQGAGSSPAADWRALAALTHTVVVYMGGSRLAEVTGSLRHHGRAGDTPAAVIVNGTGPGQQVVTGTLADIADRAAGLSGLSPALLVIGETVSLAGELAAALATGNATPDHERWTVRPSPGVAVTGG